MSEEDDGASGGAAAVPAPRPKQFNPSPPRFVPSTFDALALHEGDVIYVNIPMQHVEGHEQAEARPWVIYSSNTRMHRRFPNLVLAVPLTTEMRHEAEFREARIRVLGQNIQVLDPTRLKANDCLALTEHARSLSVDRVVDQKIIGRVSPDTVNAIRGSVRYLAGLGVPPTKK